MYKNCSPCAGEEIGSTAFHVGWTTSTTVFELRTVPQAADDTSFVLPSLNKSLASAPDFQENPSDFMMVVL
jgi:hypothetical protein